ncbi:hypothetical protein Hanom_Chr11g01057301 [Helianthus anomalus]
MLYNFEPDTSSINLYNKTNELIAKIVPEVSACLPFSSKMTLLYHFSPHVCNFLPFSSKCLTKLLYTV